MQRQVFRSSSALCSAATAVLLSAVSFALSALPARAASTSALERSSVSLGRQLPSAPIQGTVWLELHNKAALDAAVKAIYTRGSANYHKFANPDAIKQYAPTAAEVESVKAELAAHHLSVVSVDKNNLSISIKGQTSDFEAAFHTVVNQYRTKTGVTVSALAARPALGNGATGLVRAVTGVAGPGMHPDIKFPIDPDTGKQAGLVPLKASSKPQGVFYSSSCLYAPQVAVYNTPGASIPVGVYTGLVYGAPTSNTADGTLSPCGYAPQDVYKLAGLQTAYSQGYKGKGQTIAIVDAYGSPTITQDLATFNSIYGLPTSNFTVVQTVPFTATDAGWAVETTLDVEWSHAIAPEANILLVATPTNYDNDLQAGVLYVIENGLANVISNSYSGTEQSDLYYGDYEDLTSWDEVCELGALEGISVNFATGDNGDLFADEGLIDVPVPADSPYATAVGGTSVAFSPADGSIVQTGWGTNITKLGTKTTVLDPPLVEGFLFGAGGGVSTVFELPSYEASLQGTGREVPDVSAIADPYTGVEIIQTIGGSTSYEAIGGTSLATPVFSAEWALLDQLVGAPLGQAAPYVALLAGTAAINDVVAPAFPSLSVYGGIYDSKGVTLYTAADLIQPETDTGFLGTLYHGPSSGSHYDLSFGTDSSLPVLPGWDPVTGWGTLNMSVIFTAAVPFE